MVELEKTLGDIERYLQNSRKGFRRGWEWFNKAGKEYDNAKAAREQILQSILEEKGLAVCCSCWEKKNIENPSAEQLGIYPRHQMRLHFIKEGPYTVQGEYEDSIRWTERLDLLCPEHFPQNRKWTSGKSGEYTYMDSEVVQQDGKFILTVDGSDITRLVENGGIHIDPNGKRPYLIDNSIYRHFGIPDLPEKSEFDSIQYGR